MAKGRERKARRALPPRSAAARAEAEATDLEKKEFARWLRMKRGWREPIITPAGPSVEARDAFIERTRNRLSRTYDPEAVDRLADEQLLLLGRSPKTLVKEALGLYGRADHEGAYEYERASNEMVEHEGEGITRRERVTRLAERFKRERASLRAALPKRARAGTDESGRIEEMRFRLRDRYGRKGLTLLSPREVTVLYRPSRELIIDELGLAGHNEYERESGSEETVEHGGRSMERKDRIAGLKAKIAAERALIRVKLFPHALRRTKENSRWTLLSRAYRENVGPGAEPVDIYRWVHKHAPSGLPKDAALDAERDRLRAAVKRPGEREERARRNIEGWWGRITGA